MAVSAGRSCMQLSVCNSVMWVAGHEADARVLQQQLSVLLAEQQAAQQYINDNPPPENSSHEHHQHQKQGPAAKPSMVATIDAVDWKWDILRPVALPLESS